MIKNKKGWNKNGMVL